MNGQTTTNWVKPAKVTEPMTVVLESAKAQKYEADWQGNKSVRYRIKCKNDIMLDTTGMFVKKMIDSGAKDGDSMTFNCVKDSNGRPDYNISVASSNGMGITKDTIQSVFGEAPNDSMEAKVNSLMARVTALENKLNGSEKKQDTYDDGIPF
tara:strand:+ start:175 stop:630 length:456 start_codon:yes stop_codon:yes gene_type:complete